MFARLFAPYNLEVLRFLTLELYFTRSLCNTVIQGLNKKFDSFYLSFNFTCVTEIEWYQSEVGAKHYCL